VPYAWKHNKFSKRTLRGVPYSSMWYLTSQIMCEAHFSWNCEHDSPHLRSEHTTRQDSIKGVPYAWKHNKTKEH
jgi:hypothetical protein